MMGDYSLTLSAIKAGFGIGLLLSPLARLDDGPDFLRLGIWQADNPLTYFVITDPNVVSDQGTLVANKICEMANCPLV